MKTYTARVLALSELGERICILGPSNSGKSTLAAAIARKRELQVVHLDLLFHLPGTDWEPRPFAEFECLHDDAIEGSRWVMEGNYSQLLPKRLLRATGVIFLDISAPRSMFRYVRRSLGGRERVGALEGGKDSVKWKMLKYLAITTPRNRRRYAAMQTAMALPTVRLLSAAEIDGCYAAWGLTR